MFYKKDVFKNFAKFTINTCDGVSLFNKVADLRLFYGTPPGDYFYR